MRETDCCFWYFPQQHRVTHRWCVNLTAHELRLKAATVTNHSISAYSDTVRLPCKLTLKTQTKSIALAYIWGYYWGETPLIKMRSFRMGSDNITLQQCKHINILPTLFFISFKNELIKV